MATLGWHRCPLSATPGAKFGSMARLLPPSSSLGLPNGGRHAVAGRILGVSIAEPQKGIYIIMNL